MNQPNEVSRPAKPRVDAVEPSSTAAKPRVHRHLREFADALLAIVEVSQHGEETHPGADCTSWRATYTVEEQLDAMMRHKLRYDQGKEIDDSQLPQLAHIAWRAMAALQRALDDANLTSRSEQ